MAEIIEAEGKTVEEALSAALDKLGCGRAEVTYEVLQQPSRGFLGLWGKRDARIRVTTHPVIVPQTEQRSAPPQPAYQQESPHTFSQTPRRFHTDLRTPAARTAEADASDARPSYDSFSSCSVHLLRRNAARGTAARLCSRPHRSCLRVRRHFCRRFFLPCTFL